MNNADGTEVWAAGRLGNACFPSVSGSKINVLNVSGLVLVQVFSSPKPKSVEVDTGAADSTAEVHLALDFCDVLRWMWPTKAPIAKAAAHFHETWQF